MALHWTYSPIEPGSDLQQGDILARTDELLGVLSDVHAYFCDERYLAFLVVTQSCDLVRRKEDACKARHISLAVIREMDHVLPTLVREIGGYKDTTILKAESKLEVKEFVSRVLDQNEQARGLFYLHPSLDAGIAVGSVAFLRVTITLRQEHYALLQRCRVGRVEPEFANKLGWLVGNLYSRIGTPDWSDKESGEAKEAIVKRYLSDAIPESSWVPESWITAAESQDFDLGAVPGNPADHLKQFAPPHPLDSVIEEVYRTALTIRIEAYGRLIADAVAVEAELQKSIAGDVVSHLSHQLGDAQPSKVADQLISNKQFLDSATIAIRSIINAAKKSKAEDPILDALNLSELNSKCLPALKIAIEKALQGLEVSAIDYSVLLEKTPFFRPQTFSKIRAIIQSNGHDSWQIEIATLRKRLLSNGKLKSLIGN